VRALENGHSCALRVVISRDEEVYIVKGLFGWKAVLLVCVCLLLGVRVQEVAQCIV
jgi:hypothetical protein